MHGALSLTDSTSSPTDGTPLVTVGLLPRPYCVDRVAVKVPNVERKPLKLSSSTVLVIKIVLPAMISFEVN